MPGLLLARKMPSGLWKSDPSLNTRKTRARNVADPMNDAALKRQYRVTSSKTKQEKNHQYKAVSFHA